MPALAPWGREWQPVMMTRRPGPGARLRVRLENASATSGSLKPPALDSVGTGLFLLNFELIFFYIF